MVAEVVPVPGVFKVDPVGVDSAPGVVDSLHTGFVLVAGVEGKSLAVGHLQRDRPMWAGVGLSSNWKQNVL